MRHITQIKKILHQKSMFGAVMNKPIKQQLSLTEEGSLGERIIALKTKLI